MTSVGVYVKHGRSAVGGYFRSGSCPLPPQRGWKTAGGSAADRCGTAEKLLVTKRSGERNAGPLEHLLSTPPVHSEISA